VDVVELLLKDPRVDTTEVKSGEKLMKTTKLGRGRGGMEKFYEQISRAKRGRKNMTVGNFLRFFFFFYAS